jgi:hypothetical protein
MMTVNNTRYAIYWLPPEGSLLWEKGSRWLGYDSYKRSLIDRQDIFDLTSEFIDQETLIRITQRPARYGFHATLKAPFYLDDAYTESDLVEATKFLCAKHSAVSSADLRIVDLDTYIAMSLGDTKQAPELASFVDILVEKLDVFRRPMTAEDRQQRISKGKGLDARGIELLDQWGYPAVKERFHCHLTLADTPLATAEELDKPSLLSLLNEYFADELSGKEFVDRITILKQVNGGAFCELKTMELSA